MLAKHPTKNRLSVFINGFAINLWEYSQRPEKTKYWPRRENERTHQAIYGVDSDQPPVSVWFAILY